MLKSLAVAASLLLVATVSYGQSSVEQRVKRFMLYTDCSPVQLIVGDADEEAAEIGLTKEMVVRTARSRLRAARIYTSDPNARFVLSVDANIVSLGFSIDVAFLKPVMDTVTGVQGIAVTWQTAGLGLAKSGSDIVHVLSEHMDRFIDEYLEVNEDACQ